MPLYNEIEKGVVKQCKKALKSELPSDRVMAVFINPFTGSSPPLINILWKQNFANSVTSKTLGVFGLKFSALACSASISINEHRLTSICIKISMG